MKRLLIGLLAVVSLTACGGAVTQPLSSTASTQTVVDAPTVVDTRAAAPAAPRIPPRRPGSGWTRSTLRSSRWCCPGPPWSRPTIPPCSAGGARTPGLEHGVTLLVGHTVHTGGGDLDNLEDVPVGAAAHVSGVRYEVGSVKVISKTTLAEQAPRLFAQSGPHRLVIVTCEDYNPATGHYDSNVVLTATRSPS